MQPRQPVWLGVAGTIDATLPVQRRPPRRGTCSRNETGRIAQKARGWAADRHPILAGQVVAPTAQSSGHFRQQSGQSRTHLRRGLFSLTRFD